jgi:hypothetical protein
MTNTSTVYPDILSKTQPDKCLQHHRIHLTKLKIPQGCSIPFGTKFSRGVICLTFSFLIRKFVNSIVSRGVFCCSKMLVKFITKTRFSTVLDVNSMWPPLVYLILIKYVAFRAAHTMLR